MEDGGFRRGYVVLVFKDIQQRFFLFRFLTYHMQTTEAGLILL
jgi:hypothetical protein